MNSVFADTSFWIALTNKGDAHHEKAQALRPSLDPSKIITSQLVLVEYLNYFAEWGSYFRDEAAYNVNALLFNLTITVTPHTTEALLFALEFYRKRLDKGYSFTDCISMQIMRRNGLTEALTNDKHFKQEGFRALLRAEP